MPLPTGTTSGSGRTRSEAAIEAWKHRQRAAPQSPGGLSPKIAARVKEILAAKQKAKDKKLAGPKPKAKPKGKKAPDPAKAKEKAARLAERATAKQERDKAKAERVTAQAAAKQEREKAKVERVAAAQAKQQATLKKQKVAAQSAKEKSKAKAKAGASAKPAKEKAEAPAPKAKPADAAKKQADNRAKVAKDMADQDAGLSPTGTAALNDFADGKPLKEETAAAFEKMGLTEKDEQGNHRLTTEGRAAASAMNKGDTRAAIDAISRAGSKKAKANQPKAEKAIDMSELAIKAGARHSRSDIQHLQSIHDSSVACGASCDTESDDSDAMPDDDEEEGVKAIKGIMDNPLYYAQHECQDIMQAANALSTMAMLIQSELVEEDEDPQHIAMLCDAAHTLVDFIDSELDELEKAGKDAAHDAGMGQMKAITEREDVNPKAGVEKYGAVTFADAKNKKYPIDTADHVRAAWNYIAKEANAAKYDPDEVSQIKSKIVSAWRRLIDKAGPPSAGKAIDDAWLHIEGDAIKALENDIIRGYAVRFGDSDHPDLQKDYYTKATDFWLDHFGWPRPITYHHGMDAGTRNDPVVGHWLKAGIDDVGIWMEGQMDRAHAYYKAMKELAARGYIRLSSDSAPQWVIREKQQNGVNEIKRWPLITSSLTVTPMEPRMLPVEVKAFLAEIGFEGIDDSQEAANSDPARSDATKASDEERARMLLLELDLIELETA